MSGAAGSATEDIHAEQKENSHNKQSGRHRNQPGAGGEPAFTTAALDRGSQESSFHNCGGPVVDVTWVSSARRGRS